MSWARVVTARLLALFGHTRLERELDDEVRFHLEMHLEANLRAGMNPAEARCAALRSFGGIESMKEHYRERRAFALAEDIASPVVEFARARTTVAIERTVGRLFGVVGFD